MRACCVGVRMGQGLNVLPIVPSMLLLLIPLRWSREWRNRCSLSGGVPSIPKRDERGLEKDMDFVRMLRIVVDETYQGPIGIACEGAKLSEPDGIRATKRLHQRIRDEFSHAAYCFRPSSIRLSNLVSSLVGSTRSQRVACGPKRT